MQKMRFQLLLCFTFMVVVPGCRNGNDMHTLLIKSYPKEFKFIKYNNGKAGEATIVKSGDYLYDELLILISNEKIKWKRDFTTYAPQNILHSEKMNVNFINRLVIINFTQNGKKWVQIVTESEKPIIKVETEKNTQ